MSEMTENNRLQIKLIDNQFAHGKSFGTGDLNIPPVNFDWYRGTQKIGDLIVFSEDTLEYVDQFDEKFKVGFIIEAPGSNQKPYDFISNPDNYNKFSYILTFNKNLINLNPDKFKFYAFGGCWILPNERFIYPKSKNISIIASSKNTTTGHRLRHEIIQKYGTHIEGLYGGGYQFVQNKIEALKDFKYSIIVEQDNCDALFSEKLIDCLMTGTIPIYWGCKSISDFFNPKGILSFDDISELEPILLQATEQNYIDSLDAIKENFEKAKEFVIPEDYMWEKYFKNHFVS